MDNNPLANLAEEWLAAKDRERAAVAERRKAEDQLLSLIGVPESFEGTETATPDGFEIKITGRMTRKVDAEKVAEIAREKGITAKAKKLFRWKAEINAAAWKALDDDVVALFHDAVTTQPARASFAIKRSQENDEA